MREESNNFEIDKPITMDKIEISELKTKLKLIEMKFKHLIIEKDEFKKQLTELINIRR